MKGSAITLKYPRCSHDVYAVLVFRRAVFNLPLLGETALGHGTPYVPLSWMSSPATSSPIIPDTGEAQTESSVLSAYRESTSCFTAGSRNSRSPPIVGSCAQASRSYSVREGTRTQKAGWHNTSIRLDRLNGQARATSALARHQLVWSEHPTIDQ